MVKSDTTNRENGLLQRCEDICGLGATGITGNTTLYSQFVGWLNQWHKTAAAYAINSWDGADFDDKGYTTAPYGRLTGTTNRDYNLTTMCYYFNWFILFTFNFIGHDRRSRFRDRTPTSLKTDILNRIPCHLERDRHFVPAEGVMSIRLLQQ